MDELLQQVKHSVHLQPHEKEAMRVAVRLHMEQLPAQHVQQQGYQNDSRWLSLQIVSMRSVTALSLVLLLLTSGVSFAAASALPGEALYGVKRGVNERLRLAFAFSPEERAEVHVALVATRLGEAEKLAQAGKLSAAEQVALEKDVTVHTERARVGVAELEANNQDDVAADAKASLDATLNAHTQVLLALGAVHAETKPNLDRLIAVVAQSQEPKTIAMRALIPRQKKETSPSKARVTARLKTVRSKIKQVTEYVEQHDAQAGIQASGGAVAKLQESEAAATQGQIKLQEDGGASEAGVLTKDADRLANEAQILIQASAELGLGKSEREQETVMSAAAPAMTATSTASSTSPRVDKEENDSL